MKRFVGKVVVVTGGASGIGRACCLRFAAEGASVAVLDMAEEPARGIAAACQQTGQAALALRCNVADKESVDAAIAAVLEAWGHIDVLVASAGVHSSQPLVDVPLREWQRVLDIDLTGVFLCNQAVAPILMRQRSGSIINLSSMAGKTSWAGTAQYSAAKSGVIGLTRSVAMELAAYDCNANAVCPGHVAGDMMNGVAQALAGQGSIEAGEWLRQRAQDCPMKRFAAPEEIAGVVSFLASADGHFINGQAIEVDGGMVMS